MMEGEERRRAAETDEPSTTATASSSPEVAEVIEGMREKLKIGDEVEKRRETEIMKGMDKYLGIVIKEKEEGKGRTSGILEDESTRNFLLGALADDSQKVVSAGMDVLQILLSTKKNHLMLQKPEQFKSLLEILEKISRNDRYPSEMRTDAFNMVRLLRSSSSAKQPLHDQSSFARNAENVNKGKGNGESATLKRAKQRGKETILQLKPGILQQVRYRTSIQETLIKVHGIISLTFDLDKQRCIIRGKYNVDPDVFGKALARSGLAISLVYKKDGQTEELVPVQTEETGETVGVGDLMKENVPDYLPEDEYENTSVIDSAVCKQRSQQEPENAKEGSIFNSALNFVRTSFYW